MMSENDCAGSTKNRVGSVTRIELVYVCGTWSPRYACMAPAYTPRCEVRLTSTSSPPTRRDSTTVPSIIT